ncbi:YwpF-like family protein [Alkalicoccus halolimnae]|uniref:YwpF-like family protein n=1 Tax=Alkalicoccus halolimnae TaxID=1667239 RepID=A0A5C7FLN4_9BACI|nr:YwpF-like family protein [Alkalicoccus halolimnae]TXF87274.1 hypothetical protein FTX54_00695 [Alkalicoccus halolimnae]
MKTFRLCSLTILFDEAPQEDKPIKGKEIPLRDGLIINKEEAEKNWLLEAVVDKDWLPFFEDYLHKQQPLMAEVTITKRTNDPATLYSEIKAVHELDEHLSVHIEGRIVAKREDLSDMLLRNLLDEGYKGEALYEEYRRRKKDRGRAIQSILSNAYEQAREQGLTEEDHD